MALPWVIRTHCGLCDKYSVRPERVRGHGLDVIARLSDASLKLYRMGWTAQRAVL